MITILKKYLNNGIAVNDPVILKRAKQVYNLDILLGVIAPILVWFLLLKGSGIYKDYFIPLLGSISCLSILFIILVNRGWYLSCAFINTIFYLLLPFIWIDTIGAVTNAFYLISLSLNGFIYFPHRRRWGIAIFLAFIFVTFLIIFHPQNTEIQITNLDFIWTFLLLFLLVLVFRISTLLVLYWSALMEKDKEEERYRSIFENHLIGSVATRGDQIIDANQAMCNMLGYTKEEIYQLKPQDVVLPYNHEEYVEKTTAMMQGQIEGFTMEKAFCKKNGEPLFCLLSMKCFFKPDGDIDYVMSSIMDRTENKEKEDLIQLTVGKLDQRNQELERYIESNLQLENFAYIASHDLKSPLRTIISFAQLLKRSSRDKLDSKESDFLQYIISGAENMNKLLGDLLAYSRVNTEKYEYKLLNLNNIIDTIKGDLKVDFEENGVRLHVAPLLPKVVGDETKIRQLFQNLIANSIKFRRSEADSYIHISMEEEGDFWLIKVEDNGIGIKEEFFEKIFLLFRKLHTTEEYKGTGIGLALCKKIVEQHGGRMWVESTYGEGTTFYFTLKKECVLTETA